jgi:hypothetical protein
LSFIPEFFFTILMFNWFDSWDYKKPLTVPTMTRSMNDIWKLRYCTSEYPP